MSFKSKFNSSINNANNGRSEVKYQNIDNVPDNAEFWDQNDILKKSESVIVEGCDLRRRKDGTVFYELTLADKRKVTSENPCESGVARVVTIPAGVFTMKFNSDTGKFSTTEVAYCDTDRMRVLGAGVLTYGMKLKQQLAEGLIKSVSVD
jgi:hypothetical protein